MSRFLADFYSLYRPLYPEGVYADLAARLSRLAPDRLPELLDLACGTGHSTESILRAGIAARIVGADPDAGMLEFARQNPYLTEHGVEWVAASAETLPWDAGRFDAVLVGSAFHWFDPEKAPGEIRRVLRPGGVARVYEYQFPKAPAQPELTEWIRRQFNLFWKAPGQTPRGNFKSVIAPLGRAGLTSEGVRSHPMRLALGAYELAGLIVSQSRYLHYENALPDDPAREAARRDLRDRLAGFLGRERPEFDFALQSATFVRPV